MPWQALKAYLRVTYQKNAKSFVEKKKPRLENLGYPVTCPCPKVEAFASMINAFLIS
jgi:hypothetical protein